MIDACRRDLRRSDSVWFDWRTRSVFDEAIALNVAAALGGMTGRPRTAAVA